MIGVRELYESLLETKQEQLSELFDWLDNEDLYEVVLTERPAAHTDSHQVWGDVPKDVSQEEKETILRSLYKKAVDLASTAIKGFTRLLKRSLSGKPGKILVDIKPEDSFIDKILNRGKSADKIHDVLRSAILVHRQEDLDFVIKRIKKNSSVFEYDEKIMKPEDDFGYYGSHHFKIFVPAGDSGIIAEIQVMTTKLWTYKKAAHKIYKKYRTPQEAEKHANDLRRDMAQSKQFFNIGNKSFR